MRLKNVIYVCEQRKEELAPAWVNRMVNNMTYYEAANWPEILEVLHELEEIEVLREYVEDIYAVSTLTQMPRMIRLSGQEKSLLDAQFRALTNAMTIIGKLGSAIDYTAEEGSFDIKLPMNEDLADLKKNISDICLFFEQNPLLSEKKDAQIKMKGVDVGSAWMVMMVIGKDVIPVMILIGILVKQGMKIYQEYNKCRAQQEMIKKQEAMGTLQKEMAETMVSGYDDIYNAQKEILLKELEGYDKLKPEEQGRLKMCYDSFINLLDKGVEMHVALDSTEEVKLAFPSSQEWGRLEEKVLGIEEKE